MDHEEQRAEAERALRRGELKVALAGYLALAKAFPDDEAIVSRLLAIRELVQQGELMSPKAAAPRESGPASPVALAEEAASRGDLAEALALYRKAVADEPGNQLYLERMGELLAELRARGPVAAVAPPASRPPAPRPAPRDPVAILEELLARVIAAPRRS